MERRGGWLGRSGITLYQAGGISSSESSTLWYSLALMARSWQVASLVSFRPPLLTGVRQLRAQPVDRTARLLDETSRAVVRNDVARLPNEVQSWTARHVPIVQVEHADATDADRTLEPPGDRASAGCQNVRPRYR
jgi:hypothetical protein